MTTNDARHRGVPLRPGHSMAKHNHGFVSDGRADCPACWPTAYTSLGARHRKDA
jgi:hypothetical protein